MTFGLNQIIAPKPIRIEVQAQPVCHALAIMNFLPHGVEDERTIGINEWVDRVRLSLSPQQLHEVTLAVWAIGIEGLMNMFEDESVLDDFSTYLKLLGDLPAQEIRDTCLYWFVNSPHRRVLIDADPLEIIPVKELLSNEARFRQYILDSFPRKIVGDYIDELIKLYVNPTLLKEVCIRVLNHLWYSYFEAEWARRHDEIQQVVQAFAHVDTSRMTTFEAMQAITGRDLSQIFDAQAIASFERIIFIPSKHNGPYVVWFGNATTLKILFTARIPSIISGEINKPDVNTLIQRFKALSDDNRLKILLVLKERGELSTQQIIDLFDYNKSAVSRYLGQLFATGFITERRDDDGKSKYYQLNPAIVDEFVQAIAYLLQG